MTLTYGLDLVMVKLNHLAAYLPHGSFYWTFIVRTHTQQAECFTWTTKCSVISFQGTWHHDPINTLKPGIERVQALADISRSMLCCHSNETHAPIANLPNSAQSEGTPYYPRTYIRDRAVVWECGEGQTGSRDQYTFRLTPHAKCKEANAAPVYHARRRSSGELNQQGDRCC